MSSRYTLTIEGPNGPGVVLAVPSVTEILDEVLAKKGLADWYYREAVAGFGYLLSKYGASISDADIKTVHSLMKSEKKSPYVTRDDAAAEGIKIHKAVEGLAKGRRPKEYPALTTWWKEYGLRAKNILGAEAMVYSGCGGYVGTVDLVYTDPAFPEYVHLADIKTGKLRDSHEVQLELYRQAWNEMGNRPITHLTLIQVPRDGSEVTLKDVPICDTLTAGAQGLLDAYRWRH